jgi:pimeloyl-ACP methyl ester carboxylesterase
VSEVMRTTFTVETSAGPLACTRWGADDSSRPTALLVHGTGFCASVWTTIAANLADAFDVVAFPAPLAMSERPLFGRLAHRWGVGSACDERKAAIRAVGSSQSGVAVERRRGQQPRWAPITSMPVT